MRFRKFLCAFALLLAVQVCTTVAPEADPIQADVEMAHEAPHTTAVLADAIMGAPTGYKSGTSQHAVNQSAYAPAIALGGASPVIRQSGKQVLGIGLNRHAGFV